MHIFYEYIWKIVYFNLKEGVWEWIS